MDIQLKNEKNFQKWNSLKNINIYIKLKNTKNKKIQIQK